MSGSLRLLTVGSLPPELGGTARGGVATFHAALLEGLATHPDEVELAGVLAPASPAGPAPFPILTRPGDEGIAAFYERTLARLRPDAVLLNHVANTVGVTQARLDGAPPALGVAHSWHNVTFREGEERRRARAVTEEALGGLAALVCPSRHSEREGRELGLPLPRRTAAIHYPLQPLFLDGEIEVDAHERRGALYVGSLIERKNPAALVEAAALLPGLEATLVGEGEESGRLAAAIERRGLGGRVRVTALPGAVHLQALRQLFLRAEVLCLPSASESFGIVFIEALACGTPVVGFGPTVREIGAAMGVEIGEPLDDPTPAGLAAAIERVRAASWDRGALRDATLAAFSLERASRRYLDALAAVARA